MDRDVLSALRSPLRPLRRVVSPAVRTAGPGRPEVATDGGPETREPDDHLQDLPDGAGCTEIWEHLSRSAPEPSD